MLMNTFSILDGIPLALLSMLIVFVILVLLAVIISLLKLLPSRTEEGIDKPKLAVASPQLADDAEEELVAMLAASCLAKEELKGDVRIISIERTK